MATLIQSLSSRTETNINVTWTSDESLSELRYSTDGGVTFVETSETGKEGNVYISGLTPYTDYEIVLKGKISASSEYVLSPVLEVKTYNYPFCEYAPDFTIGNRLTLLIYNPLNHEITVNLIGDDGSTISNDTITGRSLTGFLDEITVDRLYQSIPDSQKGRYYIKTTYEDVEPITIEGGVYSVDTNECLPTLGNVSYEDINSRTISVTGDNQYLIRNKSIPQYTATGISAKKHATVSSVKVRLNEVDTNLSLSGSTATGMGSSVDSAKSINATFVVTDSRGIKTEKQKLVNIYDWFPPEATFDIERESDDNTGTVTVSPFFALIGGRNSVTMKCYKKKLDEEEYVFVADMTSSVPLTIDADVAYDWSIKITITDQLNSTNICYGILERYTPLAFFDSDKYSVGISCFPTNPNTLEIKGKDIYDSLFYSSGETFTISDKLYCHGLLLYNEVFFTIPLPKNVTNVTPSITTLKLNACKNSSGFLFSGGSYTTGGLDVLNENGLTITVSKATSNQLLVKIHSNAAFLETNMTQVIVELNDVNINFT